MPQSSTLTKVDERHKGERAGFPVGGDVEKMAYYLSEYKASILGKDCFKNNDCSEDVSGKKTTESVKAACETLKGELERNEAILEGKWLDKIKGLNP